MKKTRSVSKRIVEAAVAEGIGEFYFGSGFVIKTMKEGNVSPGRFSCVLGKRRDAVRKKKILQIMASKHKMQRRRLRLENIKKEEAKKAKEGVLYSAGEF